MKSNVAPACDHLPDRVENQQVAFSPRKAFAGLIEQRQREAGDGLSQPRKGLSFSNPASARRRGAEMTPSRGIRGSASGLIGGYNDRRQRGTEQRACEEQRLKLRVGAGRRKDDLGHGSG